MLKHSGVREKTVVDGLPSLGFGGHEIQLGNKKDGNNGKDEDVKLSPPTSPKGPRQQSSMSLSGMSQTYTAAPRASGLRNEVGDTEAIKLKTAVTSPTISINDLPPTSPPPLHTPGFGGIGIKEGLSSLDLKYHVFLRDRGEGHAIVAIRDFDQGRQIAVLQEHGYGLQYKLGWSLELTDTLRSASYQS
jgi:hypothetical protein